ncbi:MAG TPA: DUF29 domain-containing protein [Allosphingosinicella sp.]|jgi:hypothetical protein
MAEREHISDLRRAAPGYEADYAAWLEHQIGLLKSDRWTEVDKGNLIDEVEDLGRSAFKGFVSAIEIVIANMLKWDAQPERRSRSWQGSIMEHRRRIEAELEDSPSYSSRKDEAIHKAYRTAVPLAFRDTGLPLETFPEACPYTWDDIMDRAHELGA